jgi:type I restriction enzyme S subunit
MSNELQVKLPDGWIWSTLGELAVVVSGGTPSTDEPSFWGGSIPWITPADLSDFKGKYISTGQRSLTELGLNNSSAVLLPKGSLLFSSRAPIGYLAIAQNELATNQGFKNLIPLNSTCVEYIYYYLQFAKEEAIKRASGTTFLELSAKSFSQIPIPVPPLNQQKRIVSKIEELFSVLDKNLVHLSSIAEKIEMYRQVVLKNAFEGKLTQSLRESNAHLNSSTLLATIRQAKILKFDDQLLAWTQQMEKWKAAGKRGKKPIKPQLPIDFPELTKEEKSKLPTIPKQWQWVRNNELLFYITSGSREWKKYYSNKGAYFIRTQDIKTNQLSLDGIAHVDLPSSVEGKRSLVEKDDLLMTITGANVGKIAHVTNELPETYVSQSVALMKPVLKDFSPFLHLYFQSTGYGASFIQKLVYGVGRPVLSLENIREVPVILCSIEEQKQICNIVEELFSKADYFLDSALKGFNKVDALRKSILRDAFSGVLVNNDLSDSNASRLILQLQEERLNYLTDHAKDKKRRKVNKKKTTERPLSLVELIKKYFVDDEFTIEDLKKKTQLTDVKFKEEFFKILENGDLLKTSFDEKRNLRVYKVKL